MRYLLALLVLLFALPANAQLIGIPGVQTATIIQVTPTQPDQNSTVRLKLLSPVLDLKSSFISWHVNDALLGASKGLTEVSVPIGNAGETLSISANAVTEDGDTAYTEFLFTPAGVDILWESEGYTPPFYRGRTLPGVGASITFVAYPTFTTEDGRIPERDLVYTWRRGSTVLGASSGEGRSTLVIRDPLLGAETISVEVETADGTQSARSSVRLPEPVTILRLYEDHSLFGTLFHKAFGAAGFTTESEMSFLAVPYFAPSRTLDDGTLTFEWRVNQRVIEPNASKPSAITINAQGSDGRALIELEVAHITNYFFSENAAWHMTFSSAESNASTNPFAPQQ